MDLRTYLFTKRMTGKDFAKLIQYHPNLIYRVIGGSVKVSKRMAFIIEQATNGEVKPEDFVYEKK